MKHSYALVWVLFVQLIAPTHLVAQGKAYDEYFFTAKLNDGLLQLTYADGYLLGCTIHIIHNKKQELLIPEGDLSNRNGDLKFIPSNVSKTNPDYVYLKGVDPQSSVPLTFHAMLFTKGKLKNIVFRRLHY